MNRFWGITAGAFIGLTLIFELVFRHQAHPHYWWHAVPVFDLPFGLIGCAALILASKWLGHRWLERPELYYEDEQQ